MDIASMVALANERALAEKEFKRLHLELKKFHNTVYAPMCEAKKEAKIRLQELDDRLAEHLQGNDALIAMLTKLAKVK